MCQAQLQGALAGKEATQQEIAQLKNKMVAETEQNLYLTEERDRALSQLLERGTLLVCVRTEASRCTTQLTELKTVAFEISQDVVTLVTEVSSTN